MPDIFSFPIIASARKTLSEVSVNPPGRILVGVSGGMDSMVLMNILHELGYAISVAHVNFQLRGNESDGDALFVKNRCIEKNIPYHEHKADTLSYASDKKLNIQSAAREIRYQWWQELMESGSYDFLATAHHADDNVETLFINLFRGTGIKGLRGIPVIRDEFIRPLLRVTRQEIEEFAQAFHIPYRTDSSNLKDDYLRNRIRHHVIPILHDLDPNMDAVMKHSLMRISIEWDAWDFEYQNWQSVAIEKKGDGYHIKVLDAQYAFLLRWLEEQGFPWSLSYDFINASPPHSHSTIDHNGYRLSRTRDGFYFEKITRIQSFFITQPGSCLCGDGELLIEYVGIDAFSKETDAFTEFINPDVVKWPLELRHVNEGDRFMPFGMHGMHKKLQDFMVDLKLDSFEKSQTRVLVSDDQILWVVGRRLDERTRIDRNSSYVYKIQYRPL